VGEYCRRLKSLAPNVKDEWCIPEFHMDRIISPEAVLEKALDPAVLIVLGTRDSSAWERHLRTSYPYRLLANAACPIITVGSRRADAATVADLL